MPRNRVKVPLSTKRAEELRNMPIIQHRVFKSKDGRFIVNQTRISSIKPVEYYEKVLDGNSDDLERQEFFYD